MAFQAMPVTSLYSATKAFVLTYSQSIAQEVAGEGLRIQAVLPAGAVTEFYDKAGVPISALDQSVFMSAEQLVDAALEGFDRGEAVTLPSLHDATLMAALRRGPHRPVRRHAERRAGAALPGRVRFAARRGPVSR
jgi:short-subunit dehydrogenase